MALMLKADVAFTNTSIPILYPDIAMTDSTVVALDALDPASWLSQAAPSVSDTWGNLAGGAGATFNPAPGWSNGFTFAGGGSGGSINLPAAAKVAANQVTGFLVIVWFKTTTVASGVLQAVAGCTSGTPATSQWLFYLDGSNLVCAANGGTATQINANAANTVYQVALAYDGDGAGNFSRKSWRNGVLAGAGASQAAASILVPPGSAKLGKADGINALQGTVYRCVFDTLTGTKDPAEIVARDYAANVGRFV